MTPEELADRLENGSMPHAAAIKLVPDSAEGTGSATDRLIFFVDRREFIVHVNTEIDLSSLFPDEQMLSVLQRNHHEDFFEPRSAVLRRYLTDFLSARTAYEHENTPPLEE